MSKLVQRRKATLSVVAVLVLATIAVAIFIKVASDSNEEARNRRIAELMSAAIDPGDSNGVQLKEDGSVWVAFVDTGVDFDGNKIGYYVEIAFDVFLYSDSSLNPDEVDRMYAYLGNGDTIQVPTFTPGIFGLGEWILAWDTDQAGGGEGELDFNDFMIIVESSHPYEPVPAPATLGLLGLGLAGIGFARRRRKAA